MMDVNEPNAVAGSSTAESASRRNNKARRRRKLKKPKVTETPSDLTGDKKPSPSQSAGSSTNKPIVFEESDCKVDAIVMNDPIRGADVHSPEPCAPSAPSAPATPSTNLRGLAALPFSSSFTPFRPTLLGVGVDMGEQQDELFYADTSTKALKKKTLEDLKALAKPSASRGIDKQDSAVASKIIDADMDTSELAELEDVENQGEELSESLGMSDGAGIKGKEPASARLQNQRTPVATVDGADATATPRAGSPGPRVRMQGGLLLPMNVEIDDDRVMDDAEAVEVDQDDLDHIEVLDDVSAMPDRSVPRYFVETTADGKPVNKNEGVICKRCNRRGHIAADCSHIVCQYCGELDQHDSRQCPEQMLCFNCGERGHFSQDCPMPKQYQTSCGECGGSHMTKNCRLLWRRYTYLTVEEREEALARREQALANDPDGWTHHIFGGTYRNGGGIWCCNCAAEGHWGDDCPDLPPPKVYRLVQPTAFSKAVAMSGPFASHYTEDTAPTYNRQHTRFPDSNFPIPRGAASGPQGNVGQLGRAKDRARARERDRAALGDEDEEDDPFSRMASGKSRGGGGGGSGGGQRPNGAATGPKNGIPTGPRGGPRGGGFAIKFDAGRSYGTPGSSRDSRPSSRASSPKRDNRQNRDDRRDRANDNGRYGHDRREEPKKKDRHRNRDRDRERSPDRSNRDGGIGRSRRNDRDEQRHSRNGGSGGGRDTERDFEAEWRREGHGGGPVADWEVDDGRKGDEVRRNGGRGEGDAGDHSRQDRSSGSRGGGYHQRYHGGY